MALHFSAEEFAERRRRASAAMAEAKLDGLLMFRQESMYYLTGYDTFGYVFFQCLYLGADGRLTLLTRLPGETARGRVGVLWAYRPEWSAARRRARRVLHAR